MKQNKIQLFPEKYKYMEWSDISDNGKEFIKEMERLD